MVFGKTLVAWLCPRLSQNCYFRFLRYPLSAYLHHLLLAFSQSWFWYGGNHTYLTVFTFIHGGLLVPLAVILSQILLDNNLTVALGCEHCHHYRTPFLLKLSASAQLHWVHDHLVLQHPWHTGLCHPHNISSCPCSQHLRCGRHPVLSIILIPKDVIGIPVPCHICSMLLQLILVFLRTDSAFTNLLSENLTHATASLVYVRSITPGPVTVLVNFSIATVYGFQRVCLGIFHFVVIWLDGVVGCSVQLIAPSDQLMVLCLCLNIFSDSATLIHISQSHA